MDRLLRRLRQIVAMPCPGATIRRECTGARAARNLQQVVVTRFLGAPQDLSTWERALLSPNETAFEVTPVCAHGRWDLALEEASRVQILARSDRQGTTACPLSLPEMR